jgi:(hydroxyamino)benzene mutase
MFHAVLLLLLGLIEGIFVQSLKNPRLALSAHVGTLMSGLFLGMVAAGWRELRLGESIQTITAWLALYGMYVSSAGLTLAAAFGTSRSTPIAGAGMRGLPAQEGLVDFALVSGGIAALACCVVLLWGLRGRIAPAA